jgi:hypothetical protein
MSSSGTYMIGGTGVSVLRITGNIGGAVPPDITGNLNIVGNGTDVIVTGAPGTNTLTISVNAPIFKWNNAVGATQAIAVNNGYIDNFIGVQVLTLPAIAAVGDQLAVLGSAAGNWQIAQNAGQTIHLGNKDTTPGIGGSLTATNRYDSIVLVCTVTNLEFATVSAIGNITVT